RFIRAREEVVEQQRSRPARAEGRPHRPARLVTSLEKRGGKVSGQYLTCLQRLVQSVDRIRDFTQGERFFADQHGRHAEIEASLRFEEPADELLRNGAETVRDEEEII